MFFVLVGQALYNFAIFMLQYTKNEERCYKHGKEK